MQSLNWYSSVLLIPTYCWVVAQTDEEGNPISCGRLFLTDYFLFCIFNQSQIDFTVSHIKSKKFNCTRKQPEERDANRLKPRGQRLQGWNSIAPPENQTVNIENKHQSLGTGETSQRQTWWSRYCLCLLSQSQCQESCILIEIEGATDEQTR